MMSTINYKVPKYSRSYGANKSTPDNFNFRSKYSPVKKIGIKYSQQKQFNLYEGLLGACTGQLIFTQMAQASTAAVDIQQSGSLPYILLFGALLAAGTLNGLMSVVKTAVDKSSEKELLEKALNRHQSFVGQTQEQNQTQNVDENKAGVQKWQALKQAAKRSQSTLPMTAQFQQGIGKSGIAAKLKKQNQEQFKLQKDNLGRAYAVATEASKPVVYVLWNEDRETSAHVLQAQLSKNFGKGMNVSWGVQSSEQVLEETTRAYAVETQPSDMRQKIIWDEDRTLSAHVLQSRSSENFGKSMFASWNPTSNAESAAQQKCTRAYAQQTKPSQPVSKETHYQFITYRRIFFYDSQTQSKSQTKLVTMDEQQVSFLAQMATNLGKEIHEILSEDRCVAAHVMQSGFCGLCGKVGFAAYSQQKLQQNEKVSRAYAVYTVPSQLVSLQQLAKEETELLHQQNQAKNPLVQLFLAIINFFKWLLSLIFGGGNNNSKPATA
eukprot:TRINITY_DN13945_c0_g1_i2.p1 TRINITY_DN13945_c0_g1~~TRINITY_DN13945_c0_g1_i2.p1  ORF type:complete len:493 (-),score=75.94 TRINITY_DN13945_c0_g1_i2:603-2081(-)